MARGLDLVNITVIFGKSNLINPVKAFLQQGDLAFRSEAVAIHTVSHVQSGIYHNCHFLLVAVHKISSDVTLRPLF